ncbi:MAG: protein translocase subunit SecD [Proteobacteria bacterium]|nr:protein translocase subunit SecD [Pseudomonadota bacterium]
MLYFGRWKILWVAAVAAAGLFFALPNLMNTQALEWVPDWIPHQKINLGLDLQGGSHLLLEVETEAVVTERMNGLVDDIRNALREEFIGYTGLGVSGYGEAGLTIRNPDELAAALERIQGAANLVQSSPFGGTVADIEIDTGDGGEITVRLTEAAIAARVTAAVQQSIEVVRRRIDETGTREPSIQRQGDDRILVQLPGVDDPDRIKRLLGQTAKLTFQMVDPDTSLADAVAGRLPPGSIVLPSANEVGADGTPLRYVLRARAIITGEMLTDSQATFDGQTGQPVVSLRFDATGARRFGEVTSENVGRRFAIVLDNEVISAPVIREAILGGVGQISGSFTVQAANDLAVLLRAGALPAPLVILEERTVGPGLGADSVRAGGIASILAFVLVMVFMLAAYGRFGLAADAALLINVMLIAAALSALQATLTLPGIAGIILTIGMAVDANVLVFERIREEVRSGKTPFAAVESGYRRAMTTIIDANVTTLIAAVILFMLGSGPVRGFAVTLSIGVVTSMFTAITVTRLFVATWLTRARPKLLPI